MFCLRVIGTVCLITAVVRKIGVKMHQRSSLGNILDRIKTSTLICWLIVGVLVAAILFYFLSGIGHGIQSTIDKDSPISIFDSIYFSIVTVSSLGYGDYRPIGAGRILATVEVIYGLVFLAIIVSKLASERTSTLIKLVYASDTQRRLLDFIESSNERNHEMNQAILDHNYFIVSELASRNKTAFSTCKHFINYHHKFGDIGNDWDEKQNVRLIKAVAQASDLANVIISNMHTDPELHNRIESYLRQAESLSEHINDLYSNDRISRIHGHIISQKNAFIIALERAQGDFWNLRGINGNSITDNLLARVEQKLPERPWPENIHKAIAKDLKISNKLANKVITKLSSQGEFSPANAESTSDENVQQKTATDR